MILGVLFECLIVSYHRIPLYKVRPFLCKFIDSRLLFILNVHGFIHGEILSMFHLPFGTICAHSVVSIDLIRKHARLVEWAMRALLQDVFHSSGIPVEIDCTAVVKDFIFFLQICLCFLWQFLFQGEDEVVLSEARFDLCHCATNVRLLRCFT